MIQIKLKQQLQQLEKQLTHLQLDKTNVCVVGSYVLALKNIRQNRDLDIIILPKLKKKISKKKKAFHITNHIEVVGDNWASTIKINDESMINDSRFYNLIYGFKVVKPEILFLVMLFRGKEKNIKDLELLEKYALSNKSWDWDLIKNVIPKSKTHDFKIKKTRKNQIHSIIQLPEAINSSLRNQLILKLPISVLLNAQLKNGIFYHYDLLLYYIAIQSIITRTTKKYSNVHKILQTLDPNFFSDLLNLVTSFKTNGFFARYPIVITPNGLILDGIKRIACALYFDIQEIPVLIQRNKKLVSYDDKWIKQKLDKKLLLKIDITKDNLFRKYGIWTWIMLWSPSKPWFNEISNELSRFGKKKWEKSVYLGKSLPDFVRKTYSVDDIQKWKIELKISAMKNYEPIIHIIALEFPSDTYRIKNDIYAYQSKTTVRLKKLIRRKYGQKIPDYFYDIIIHIGDNHEHNSKIYEFLEQNNYLTAKKF